MSLFQEASLLLLCVWSGAVSRSLCLCILSDWGLFGLRLCESPDPSLSPSACLSPAFIWRLPLAPDPASVSPSPAPTLGPRPRRPDRLCFLCLGAPPPPRLGSPPPSAALCLPWSFPHPFPWVCLWLSLCFSRLGWLELFATSEGRRGWPDPATIRKSSALRIQLQPRKHTVNTTEFGQLDLAQSSPLRGTRLPAGHRAPEDTGGPHRRAAPPGS